MDSTLFLRDLAVVLCAASVVLLIFKRLKQPPVLGYLLAGLIVGPHTEPALIAAGSVSIEAMAQIGVIFLLFALGVEFNLKRLYSVGMRAPLVALIEVALLIPFGYWIGTLMGWNATDGLILGGIIALASTAIVARTLLDNVRHRGGWEDLATGTLIGEDIIAILLITLFSSAAQLGDLQWATIVSAQMRLTMLVTIILVTGLLILPRALRYVERHGMEEVRILIVVGACLAVSYLTERLGFSAALGAFLAGAIASTGGHTSRLHETVAPFKEVFGAIFFVSVGMSIDPAWILENWPITLSAAFLITLARIVVNFGAFTAVGEDKRSSLQAAITRIPIGEFSFILAFLAEQHGLSGQPLYPFAVTLCLTTTLTSSLLLPLALRKSDSLETAFPVFLDRLIKGYHAGLRRLSAPRRATQVWILVRPSLIQILLNLAGIGGLFIAAGALQKRYHFEADIPGVVWMITALLSLPFLNALSRKTQAVTLIMIEALSKYDEGGAPPFETHPRLTRFLLGLSSVLVAVWYLSLSLKLLPPWPYTLAPLLLVGMIGAYLWRRTTRLYSAVQASLRDTFSRGEAQPDAAPVALSHFIDAQGPEKVRVSTFRVTKECWAAGKPIREIDLRSLTGASILQINRGDHLIPSPTPEQHLHVGDVLLLIGEGSQMKVAQKVLEAGGT